MRILKWKNIASGNEAYNVTSLNLSGSRKKSFEMHGHDFAELFLVEYGELIHETERCSDKMKSGDIGLIRPEDCHGFRTVNKDGFLYSNVAVSRDTFNELSERYSAEVGIYWTNTSSYSLPAPLFNWLQTAIRQLWVTPHTRFEIDRFILNFFSIAQSVLASGNTEDKPEWLEYACREIRNPKYLKVGLKAFQQLAGRCPEHFGRELKKHTGLTPSELICQLRVEQAAKLLMQTNMKIDDIASECGFLNLGYFYSAFKSHHSCTPRHYRLNCRNKII